MYLFIKKHWVGIVIAIVIIALLFLGNIDAIKVIVTGWNSSIVVAITSAFIAVCALGVTVWQGLQNLKHNKLSVLPLISLTNEISVINDVNIKGDLNYKIVLTNQGVGPAIIKKFELLFDGETVLFNDADTYEKFLDSKTKKFTGRNFAQRKQGSIIKVGERLILWEFNYHEHQDTSEVEKLGLRIEYESIYQDEVFNISVRDY